ncbi:MAG TPA: hypothetical protein VIL16_12480 [Trebonia sp.]
MAGIEALGRLVDYSVGVAPVDLSGGAQTGKRVSLKNASGVQVVIFKGAASTGTDPAFTFKEATADTSGTSQVMATPPAYFYKKSATALAGTEQWAQVAATYSAGVITLTGEEGNQGIYVFDVLAEDLSAGFEYLEVDSGDAGSVAQLGGVLFIAHDLLVQRDPALLAALSS